MFSYSEKHLLYTYITPSFVAHQVLLHKIRPFYNSVSIYAGANNGRLKGYIFHPPTVTIN